MGDTKEDKVVAGAANSIYVAQAGEGPGPELSELVNPDGRPSDKGEKEAEKINPNFVEARQEGGATIVSSDEFDRSNRSHQATKERD